jgi:hypothetical protein
MVGAPHDCIISDTVAKRFPRKDFDDDKGDNGMTPHRIYCRSPEAANLWSKNSAEARIVESKK